MTGYGHAVYRTDDYFIECEIKGYNSRYLDIIHNISSSLASFEGLVDAAIKEKAKRGRVEVSLKLHVIKSSVELAIDEGLAVAYRDAYKRLASITDSASPVLSDYTSVEGILTPLKTDEASVYQSGVESVLAEALEAFGDGKIREGEGTRKDLVRLGAQFEASLDCIKSRSGELEAHYRTLLEEKYEELTGRKAGDSDFISELGAILVRYSINEEISRLTVHIAEYNKLVDEGFSRHVGRELSQLAAVGRDAAVFIKDKRQSAGKACCKPCLHDQRAAAVGGLDNGRIGTLAGWVRAKHAVRMAAYEKINVRDAARKLLVGIIAKVREHDDVLDALLLKRVHGFLQRLLAIGKLRVRTGF